MYSLGDNWIIDGIQSRLLLLYSVINLFTHALLSPKAKEAFWPGSPVQSKMCCGEEEL